MNIIIKKINYVLYTKSDFCSNPFSERRLEVRHQWLALSSLTKSFKVKLTSIKIVGVGRGVEFTRVSSTLTCHHHKGPFPVAMRAACTACSHQLGMRHVTGNPGGRWWSWLVLDSREVTCVHRRRFGWGQSQGGPWGTSPLGYQSWVTGQGHGRLLGHTWHSPPGTARHPRRAWWPVPWLPVPPGSAAFGVCEGDGRWARGCLPFPSGPRSHPRTGDRWWGYPSIRPSIGWFGHGVDAPATVLWSAEKKNEALVSKILKEALNSFDLKWNSDSECN